MTTSIEETPPGPSIFEMASNLTVGCIAVFLLADLRELAKKRVLLVNEEAGIDDNDLMLRLPFKAGDSIADIWSRNQQIIKRKMRADQYKTLAYLIERLAEEREAYPELWQTQCEYVGDEKASNECVYSIHTNPARKRIVVVFRGSITLKDWFQDSKSAFGETKNPLYGIDLSSGESKNADGMDDMGQPEMLPLHLGFLEYLYGSKFPLSVPFKDISSHLSNFPETVRDIELPDVSELLPSPPAIPVPVTLPFAKSSAGDAIADDAKEDRAQIQDEHSCSNRSTHELPQASGTNDEEQTQKKTKMATILDQISAIYGTRPDYDLYITGHSLGGALALITALEAAARFSVLGGKPRVTCVTVGNPKAGGRVFRRAVRSLEKQGQLCVLGIHRMDDLVPLLPGTICTCSVMNSFHHVGMQLKLKGGDRYTVRYLGDDEQNSFWSSMREKWRHLRLILPSMHKIKDRHFYKTYLDDLQTRKSSLGAITLNDLYADLSAS